MEPYIGITGIRSAEEISAISSFPVASQTLTSVPRIAFGIVYYLYTEALGVPREKLAELTEYICRDFPNSDAIIHLNGWKINSATAARGNCLADQISKKVIIQVNRFDWDTSSYERVKDAFPDNRIILPLNYQTVSASTCLELLSKYSHAMPSLLLDASFGTGKEAQMDEVVTWVSTTRELYPNITLGVAGGFGRDLSEQQIKIFRQLMPLNFDAESGLSRNGKLEFGRVKEYLMRMTSMWRVAV